MLNTRTGGAAALCCLTLLLTLAGCGDDQDQTSPSLDAGVDAASDLTPEADAEPDAEPDAVAIALSMTRDAGAQPNPFVVTASVTLGAEPLALEADALEISTSRGQAGPVEALGGGEFRFTVTPTASGEHAVTVRAQGASVTRVALVLPEVAPGWGQPMAVPGLVNTAGYEDGVTITPDGRHLFVQTGPMRFTSFWLFDTPREQGGCGGHRLQPTRCEHPWIDNTTGPTGPPERPGFFTGRIDGDRFLHNSNLYQVPEGGSPLPTYPTMFYGFVRQPDGSFAEPFFVAFEDEGDAIMNPFGLSFAPSDGDRATALFAFNDPTAAPSVTVDGQAQSSGIDVYATEVVFGQDNTLGRYEPGDQPQELVRAAFPPQRLGFGDQGTQGNYGTQGNPHLHVDATGQVRSVWTDDEYDADPGAASHEDYKDLSVYVLEGDFPQGPWTRVTLPEVINTEEEQIQPFFTGSGLFYTQETQLFFASYDGPDTAEGYGDAANWGAPRPILHKDTTWEQGRVIALGEPTAAVYDGSLWLYFVYGYVRGFDEATGLPDIDFNAGFVELPL